MRKTLTVIIFITSVCLSTHAEMNGGLNIYLPRQIELNNDIIQLKDIAIIRADPNLLNKAAKIKLGKFSMPGQRIAVDRITILSRLASQDFETGKVKFKGASEVSVRRKEAIIKSSDFAETASRFLSKQKKNPSIASFDLYRTPGDKIISGKSGEIKLVPKKIKKKSAGKIAVTVDAMIGGSKVSSHEITFRPSYKCRRAIAKKEITAGTILTSENVKIETYVSPRPEPENWKSPMGLVAKNNIKKGTTIKTSLAEKKKQEILIERRDSVIIKVNSNLLSVTANGEAVNEGKLGDLIKVRNLDSRRIIVCKVNYDGSVSPVF